MYDVTSVLAIIHHLEQTLVQLSCMNLDFNIRTRCFSLLSKQYHVLVPWNRQYLYPAIQTVCNVLYYFHKTSYIIFTTN
jgi:hypothetical protein